MSGNAIRIAERPRGFVRVKGPEAEEYLQRMLSNDVEALSPGSGCYATLLTNKGKIRADMRILRGEDWWLLDCEPQALPVLEHMVRVYSIGRDVECVVLARAVKWFVEHRILQNGDKTVVFK